MKVLVTGSAGFIGRHLVLALRQRSGVEVIEFDQDTAESVLQAAAESVEVVFHLAGINRPKHESEFQEGNVGLTGKICQMLQAANNRVTLVMTSSIQAVQDNPYGRSKLLAEKELERWAEAGGGKAVIFRLQNIFGKWSRPNYNSVVATFCYNIAHDLPIQISDVNRDLELVYIDDVIEALVGCLEGEGEVGTSYSEVKRTHKVKLGEIAQKLHDFRASRNTLVTEYPDLFSKLLHATYLSYLDKQDLAYGLAKREDNRGSLAEFIKSRQFGQIFVSRTKLGITRGNHFHHSKVEKFLVLEGEAIIRLRSLRDGEVVEFRVKGDAYRVVDIPPGYAHSIENVGNGELVTLFWSSDIFNPSLPDTIPCQV